ncbi:cupin domain-containing protein [Zobellia nedashkovskayae]
MATDMLKRTKENSEHYTWGDNCSGWHLVKSKGLSIIEELMPPDTKEKKHYHQVAEQFFRILNGTATFEIENEVVVVQKGEGIHIPPKTKHLIRNDQNIDLEFIVTSRPTSRGDRFEEPFNE